MLRLDTLLASCPTSTFRLLRSNNVRLNVAVLLQVQSVDRFSFSKIELIDVGSEFSSVTGLKPLVPPCHKLKPSRLRRLMSSVRVKPPKKLPKRRLLCVMLSRDVTASLSGLVLLPRVTALPDAKLPAMSYTGTTGCIRMFLPMMVF